VAGNHHAAESAVIPAQRIPLGRMTVSELAWIRRKTSTNRPGPWHLRLVPLVKNTDFEVTMCGVSTYVSHERTLSPQWHKPGVRPEGNVCRKCMATSKAIADSRKGVGL
jgi:hypothetical protein